MAGKLQCRYEIDPSKWLSFPTRCWYGEEKEESRVAGRERECVKRKLQPH